VAQEVRQSGVKAITLEADVSKEADVQTMFETVLKEFGRLDVLVNNAGIQKHARSHEMTLADFEKVLDVNLVGAFLCSRSAIRHYLERGGGGVILNTSSVHEHIPKPEFVGYSVSKWGIAGLTRTLALEYAGDKIRVNSVGPGAIVTPINSDWIHDPKATAEVESHIPLSRVGTPEEIAGAFAYLATEEASYITGQTLFVCGGLTLYPEFRGTWAS
jgi:glucose 1-dehydrogenase